jgi:hypothetical protein
VQLRNLRIPGGFNKKSSRFFEKKGVKKLLPLFLRALKRL